jgi:hypothetical protein
VVSDRDHQGYLNEQMIRDGFADGTLNPFGASDAAGLALYEAAQIRGEVRRSVGMMDSIDARASRSLMKLEGGDLALALGRVPARAPAFPPVPGPGRRRDPGRDLAGHGGRFRPCPKCRRPVHGTAPR